MTPVGLTYIFTTTRIYCATLGVSVVFAVARCPYVCHVCAFYPDGPGYRQISLSAQ